GIGIALDHRKPLGDAQIDVALRQLDAAPVGIALTLQALEQGSVLAADIEHPRPHRDHRHDDIEVDAWAGRLCRAHASPRARAADCTKPSIAENSSGSSSRKASWPRSVSISTKETDAPAALSARTTLRLSEVGNSQSLVKETTQKRVLV